MLNPIKKVRLERKLSRIQFAMLVRKSYASVYAVEVGSAATLPRTWEDGLLDAGLSWSALAADFEVWRKAQADLVVGKT